MKMSRLTKAGVLIIVIGLSFLAGTLYRSTKEGGGYLYSSLCGTSQDAWSQRGNNSGSGMLSGIYFQVPRDFRMDIKSNGTIDVYMLNSEGIRLWRDEGKLSPVVSFEGVKQQVVTFHLNSRDKYMPLVHNPSKGTAVEFFLGYSGYGIETDLLNASLGITAVGAIVTIAGLIPKRNRSHKRSIAAKGVAAPAAAVTLLILLGSIAVCTAQSTSMLAPSWMKEGTYVNYDLTPTGAEYKNGVLQTSKSIYLTFLNSTDGSGIEYHNVTSVFLRWECIKLSGDMATLNITYTIISDLPSDNFYTSALVDVNIASRSVYLQNGTLIGTTHLWLPSSPAERQEVVLWDMPPDKVTANVITKMPNGDSMWTLETSQGAQTIFQLANVSGTLDGEDFSFEGDFRITGPSRIGEFMCIGMGTYEYDTGLMLAGDLNVEPVYNALGLKSGWFNSMTTNVDMGPERTIIDWNYWLSLAAVVGAIVIIAAVLMINRRRRRK
ncbi:MAG: hypothetical protein NWE99_09565 [Candidatus Bathyarchaeota archaeon]|nr:hypothetical protein [Candidatus Bathyarchaeota archaeon]